MGQPVSFAMSPLDNVLAKTTISLVYCVTAVFLDFSTSRIPKVWGFFIIFHFFSKFYLWNFASYSHHSIRIIFFRKTYLDFPFKFLHKTVTSKLPTCNSHLKRRFFFQQIQKIIATKYYSLIFKRQFLWRDIFIEGHLIFWFIRGLIKR